MSERTIYRLRDIIGAIDQIHSLLNEKSLPELRANPVTRAAYERFLEILSEASRHIPPELKSTVPDIQWRRVADIGNQLRHGYNHIDVDILWRIFSEGDLRRLREVADQFLERLQQHSP